MPPPLRSDADEDWKALSQHRSTKRGGYYKAGEEPTYDASSDKVSGVEGLLSRVDGRRSNLAGGGTRRRAAGRCFKLPGRRRRRGRKLCAMRSAASWRRRKRRRRAEPLEATPSMLQLLRYPVAGGDLSAHSDFECFTFVHSAWPGSRFRSTASGGVWRLPADDSHCVLLAGDAVEYRRAAPCAARHRVVIRSRDSIVLFHAAADDAVLGAARRRPVRVRRRAGSGRRNFGSAARPRAAVRCGVEQGGGARLLL